MAEAKYSNTYSAKVFVKGPPYKSVTESCFRIADRYTIVDSVGKADIVVWTGGEDIWPGLYGEEPLPETYTADRDASDLEVLKEALDKQKFLVGICRGAQLLNVVPNGGKLWQDVDNHGMNVHKAFDCCTGNWIKVNSVHHQALRVTDKAEILCWAMESTVKQSQFELWKRPTDNLPLKESDKDIEAVWYPESQSLCVQFHPEFGHKETTDYFFNTLMKRYFWNE